MTTTSTSTDRYGNRRTGVVPGFEDLADPTPADVADQATLCADELIRWAGADLAPTVERDVRGRHNPTVFVERVRDTALKYAVMADALDLARPSRIERHHVERADELFKAVQEIQRMGVNHVSFAMAQDLYRAGDVYGTSRAVLRGGCPAGYRKHTACTPSAERIELRVYDDLGGISDRQVGCVWHVAEEWTHWDPVQVDRPMRGPADAVAMAARLGHAFENDARRPSFVELLPWEILADIARRAGYPHELPRTFTCPKCLRISHHPQDFDNGYCGACHAATGAYRGTLV